VGGGMSVDTSIGTCQLRSRQLVFLWMAALNRKWFVQCLQKANLQCSLSKIFSSNKTLLFGTLIHAQCF
jgi:hypothetical protein